MSNAAPISMPVWWLTPSTTTIPGSGRSSSGPGSGLRDAWRIARAHTQTVTDRRRVVFTDEVFYAIDAALPQAPGRGLPSRAQFISADLLEAVERFATSWDDLPPLIAGRDDYRVLISRGRLVYAFVVEGQLAKGADRAAARQPRAPLKTHLKADRVAQLYPTRSREDRRRATGRGQQPILA
jgi:hypothetical protein